MNIWSKYRMKFILLVMFVFPLAVCVKSYGETRNLSLLSEGVSGMKIECGPGFLKLKGVEGLDEIKVAADIVAGNKKGDALKEFIDKYVKLSLERHGDRAVLISRIESSSFSFFFSNKDDNRIDLTVEIPKEMDVEIKDGSGEIEVKNIRGKLDIDDGSGSIDIADIKGEVDITDGSGELSIRDVAGKIEIDDGSGSIDTAEVEGNVKIIDGSGEIKLERVKGDLNINDGSGSIMVADIDGSVRIKDGSGPVIIERVSRDLDIVESGSGGVQFKDVKGNVSGDL